jgi:hypothetical protein
MIEGSGSGSRRLKNLWIRRIRLRNTEMEIEMVRELARERWSFGLRLRKVRQR